MKTSDLELRTSDLLKTFHTEEQHARAKFEHDEYLSSAHHWKQCAGKVYQSDAVPQNVAGNYH